MVFIQNALYFAWSDIRARYKSSILGPYWLTIGNLIGVLGLSLVWANLLHESMQTFVPSLTIGMIVWQLVGGVIAEAPATFVRQAGIIKNVIVPIWFFVFRLVSRHLINFLHNALIIVGVLWYFDIALTPVFMLAAPGFLLVILNLFWLVYILGMAGARFRDLEYLINAFLPLLFFLSPVIFRPDHFPVTMDIIWLNPVTYCIEAIRSPFLGHAPEARVYYFLSSILVAGIMVSYVLNRLVGRRLAFWI